MPSNPKGWKFPKRLKTLTLRDIQIRVFPEISAIFFHWALNEQNFLWRRFGLGFDSLPCSNTNWCSENTKTCCATGTDLFTIFKLIFSKKSALISSNKVTTVILSKNAKMHTKLFAVLIVASETNFCREWPQMRSETSYVEFRPQFSPKLLARYSPPMYFWWFFENGMLQYLLCFSTSPLNISRPTQP